MPLPSKAKDLAKRALFQVHKLALHANVQILPAHFYSPAPDLRELERTREVWTRKSTMPGVQADLDEQTEVLRRACLPFQQEYAGNAVYLDAVANKAGSGYGYIEAQALHGVVRHYKPRRIIEVGSGVSTYCLKAAVDRNAEEEGARGTITCIEPYPAPYLRQLGDVELEQRPVQTVPVETFESLGAGDLLFIDSSHTVKAGSDVNYVVLEVLPRLRPGVIVHVHDIYLPYDYQRDALQTMFHWSETSLYHAFLINNSRARILFCLSQLHYERQDVLGEVFPEYAPAPDSDGLEVREAEGHFPSSLYFQILP